MSSNSHKITIVVVDDEAPARKLLRYLVEKEAGLEVIGEAGSGVQAVSLVRSLSPDLLLLDIQMPQVDGFEVIRRLGGECPHVIFVTAYHEYALKAFEVHALDYILKPPVPARFFAAIERARRAVETERRGSQRPRLGQLLKDIERHSGIDPASKATKRDFITRLTVRDRQAIRVVEVDKINWIEAADHLAYVYFGNSKHLVDRSLAELERELDQSRFVRIRRDVIVNLAMISAVRVGKFGALNVVLRGGHEFSSSRFLSHAKRRQLILACEIKTA